MHVVVVTVEPQPAGIGELVARGFDRAFGTRAMNGGEGRSTPTIRMLGDSKTDQQGAARLIELGRRCHAVRRPRSHARRSGGRAALVVAEVDVSARDCVDGRQPSRSLMSPSTSGCDLRRGVSDQHHQVATKVARRIGQCDFVVEWNVLGPDRDSDRTTRWSQRVVQSRVGRSVREPDRADHSDCAADSPHRGQDVFALVPQGVISTPHAGRTCERSVVPGRAIHGPNHHALDCHSVRRRLFVAGGTGATRWWW